MDKENPQKPKKPQHTDLGKYSGMAFQMGITIALGTWGGIKLDDYFGFKKFPVFTITLSLSDRKSTRLNSSHIQKSRMPSSA